MAHYMLAARTQADDGRASMTDAEMQAWQKIGVLEAEMKSEGAWVFSARLHGPDTATVVRMSNGEVLTTDGPFTESKDHLGGFYVIEAADLDRALGWAAKVSEVIDHPIEVWPFAGIAWEPGG